MNYCFTVQYETYFCVDLIERIAQITPYAWDTLDFCFSNSSPWCCLVNAILKAIQNAIGPPGRNDGGLVMIAGSPIGRYSYAMIKGNQGINLGYQTPFWDKGGWETPKAWKNITSHWRKGSFQNEHLECGTFHLAHVLNPFRAQVRQNSFF